MTVTKTLLVDVKNNLSLLLSKQNQLEEDRKQLEQHIEKLQQQLSEANERVMNLEEENRQLRLAKAVSSGGTENPEEAKDKINELVREIDKCLALLNI
ncbi:MAG: Atg14 domain-containing protein [Schleiferiaceae bacterium]|jgi:chromosome segregation ATPase|nr:Atg14 domain-containing protein [Schleiferiaceae bacterium]